MLTNSRNLLNTGVVLFLKIQNGENKNKGSMFPFQIKHL